MKMVPGSRASTKGEVVALYTVNLGSIPNTAYCPLSTEQSLYTELELSSGGTYECGSKTKQNLIKMVQTRHFWKQAPMITVVKAAVSLHQCPSGTYVPHQFNSGLLKSDGD